MENNFSEEQYKINKITKIIYILSTISAVILFSIIMYFELLPPNLRNPLIIGLVTIYLLIGIVLVKSKKNRKKLKIVFSVILSITFLFNSLASFYIGKTYIKYNSRLRNNKESVEYILITRKDNPVNTILEMGDAKVYYSKEDSDEISKMAKKLLELDKKLSFTEGKNTSKNYKDLLDKKINYMILNNSYIELLEKNIKEFNKKVKIVKIDGLGNSSIKIDRDDHTAKITGKNESFILYISGSDAYENSEEPTRSDVNILLAINPKTNKILMTTIPRDSYVYMTDLGYDKLTHTGIYGIRKSISTIEELLDIDINYYAKVNFTSLIELIDVLGGVTVQNDYSFVSRIGGYYFEEGEVNLDGERALGFVRERYSLPNGDEDRARNQMKVLEAIIKKLMSPSVLINYNSILGTALRSINTNVPSSVMTEMINNQLETSAGWKIFTNEIEGEDRTDLPSFAMPDSELYMKDLYEYSIEEATEKIKEVLEEK